MGSPAADAHPGHAARPERPSGTVLTLPNVLSIIRLACIPLFVYLLFGRDNRAAAAWLFAVLGMTDWVDGYLARRLGQVSELGKILDPLADRLLLLVGIPCILIDGSAPLWFGVAVLVREALVAGATLVLAALGARRIDVTIWGKAGTFLMFMAFPCFLGANSTLSYAPLLEVVAWGTGLVGLAFSYYAASRYVPLARRALQEGRSQRRTGSAPTRPAAP
jgi:cardiolipin synthase (CMP-forming)